MWTEQGSSLRLAPIEAPRPPELRRQQTEQPLTLTVLPHFQSLASFDSEPPNNPRQAPDVRPSKRLNVAMRRSLMLAKFTTDERKGNYRVVAER